MRVIRNVYPKRERERERGRICMRVENAPLPRHLLKVARAHRFAGGGGSGGGGG